VRRRTRGLVLHRSRVVAHVNAGNPALAACLVMASWRALRHGAPTQTRCLRQGGGLLGEASHPGVRRGLSSPLHGLARLRQQPGAGWALTAAALPCLNPCAASAEVLARPVINYTTRRAADDRGSAFDAIHACTAASNHRSRTIMQTLTRVARPHGWNPHTLERAIMVPPFRA